MLEYPLEGVMFVRARRDGSHIWRERVSGLIWSLLATVHSCLLGLSTSGIPFECKAGFHSLSWPRKRTRKAPCTQRSRNRRFSQPLIFMAPLSFPEKLCNQVKNADGDGMSQQSAILFVLDIDPGSNIQMALGQSKCGKPLEATLLM